VQILTLEVSVNYKLLITTLIGAIKAVETLMPESPGKEKFDVAISMVEGVVGELTDLLPALQLVATTVVAGLKAAGVFKSNVAAKT
jgi:hypothetical protein